jgi:ribose/xylose/arabinose/galactoside ABC-type transport system permease subunit
MSVFERVPPVVWALVVMVIVFGRSNPAFLSLGNAINLARQGSILFILCMGVVVAKISGGLDLSVGGVLTLAGMLGAMALSRWGLPIPVAFVVSILVGTLGGMLNGIFVTRMAVPAFIATLGTQYMAFGLSLGINGGMVVSNLPKALQWVGDGFLLGIPVPLWFCALAFLSTYGLLNFTPFGVYVYALGGNEEALKLAGKPAWWYRVLAFTYAGMMAGLAGMIVTARNMSAQPLVGQGMEFQAFSATVIGGSFVAGRGGAVDTVLGTLFVLLLRNGLNVMGVPTYYQLAIIGVVLLTGIIMSLLVERRLQK